MNIIEEIVDDAEELFPPKPGGLVDRHRQRKAQEAAAQADAEHEQEAIEERAYKAVKTAQESPEIVSAQTFNIPAGGWAMILPQNPYRYRATINVVTASATVVLGKDSGAVLGGNGYMMSASNPPLTVFNRGALYCANTSGSTTQVSIFAEVYSPEQVDTAKPKPRPAKKEHHLL